MTCDRGDLVGIPFPYSDLSTRKRRPVLVITAPDRYGDFIGLAVTSVLTKQDAVRLSESDMKHGSLPKTSWVRCDKLFTLSEGALVKDYGAVSDATLREVLKLVCTRLGCGGVERTGEDERITSAWIPSNDDARNRTPRG